MGLIPFPTSHANAAALCIYKYIYIYINVPKMVCVLLLWNKTGATEKALPHPLNFISINLCLDVFELFIRPAVLWFVRY